MMHSNRALPARWALFLLLVTSTAFAQGNSANAPGHVYGVGHPQSVNDLPPGQLKSTLENLPPQARNKALGWLQRFSFPAEDMAHLQVDADGSIVYADAPPSPDEAGTLSALTADSPAADPQMVFKLHSRPGAGNVVFLDFDGHTLQNTGWNNNVGESVLVALPFDPSGNDSPKTVANFTQEEINRIAEIWHRVAEDFAAFDIDVTTEEPNSFTSTTGHILITRDLDASGRQMPRYNASGVAYTNVFGRSDYTYYSPALVYYNHLYDFAQGFPTLVAEISSHEFGHNLGLSHDGIVGSNWYYQGHGNGLVNWGPIMGTSIQKNVTQWSQGEYPDANNPQDDLAIIADKLGYIGDDHADSAPQATALVVDTDGTILASSPELDPDNVLTENKGVIGDRDDVDWFYLDVTGSGTLEVTATPSWHSFTRNDERGSNLDIELSLFNSNLTLVAADEPDDETNATVTATVNPGRYYLKLDGVGNDTRSDYSDYASTGMYFIDGAVPMDGSPVDTTPPSPAQMSWQSPPTATGTSSISMTAVTATDASGSVEYYFTCVAGGPGCSSSGWQTSRTFTDSGLQANTSYSYNVRARDAAGNVNTPSATTATTTDNQPTEDTTPPSPDPMSWQSPPTATGTSSISMTAAIATDNSGYVEYYFACVSGNPGCSSSSWQTSRSFTDSGLQADTTYSYMVLARDAAGNRTRPSPSTSATTDAAGSPSDTTPPSPSQMSWQSPPTATGTSSISMTAVTATDASGSVQYSFSCVSGGPGCSSSGWQSSRTFTDSGLQANTSYSYNVRARDAAGNVNNPSAAASATTDDNAPPPNNQPPVAVASYSPDPAIIQRGKTVLVMLDGGGSYDPDGSITGWSWRDATGTVVSTNSQYAEKLREGEHSYTLTVTDNQGASDVRQISIIVSGIGKGRKLPGGG